MTPIAAGMASMFVVGVVFNLLHRITPFPLSVVPLMTPIVVIAFFCGAVFLGSDDDEAPRVPPSGGCAV